MSGRVPGNIPTTLKLRPAEERHVPAITQLVNQAFAVERFFLVGDRLDAAEVRERLQRGAFLLLEDSGVIVACVYVELRGESGFIGLLSVEPRRQKSGLSRVLMNAAENYFRRHGCGMAELRIVNLRTELPPYYEHMGYRAAGTETFPPEIPVILPCHLIVMTKALL